MAKEEQVIWSAARKEGEKECKCDTTFADKTRKRLFSSLEKLNQALNAVGCNGKGTRLCDLVQAAYGEIDDILQDIKACGGPREHKGLK